MDWTDIIITINTKDSEKAQAIAHMAIPRGLYIEDYSTFDEDIKLAGPVEIIDEELLKMDRSHIKIHVYVSPEENPAETISFLTERLKNSKIDYELSAEGVNEEDWANNWKKYFKPTPIGEKLIIVPSWENDNLQNDRIKILIDPGMAFGSGQHETTKLCMEFIEKYAKENTEMLDVGTGSGILAIAGLLLGIKHATGVDIDPLSIRTARENAAINGVEDKMTVKIGNLADDIEGTFDLVTANIVADIIIELLPDLRPKLSETSVFICSGIIDAREDDVISAIVEYNYNIIDIKRERGWTAIAAKLG